MNEWNCLLHHGLSNLFHTHSCKAKWQYHPLPRTSWQPLPVNVNHGVYPPWAAQFRNKPPKRGCVCWKVEGNEIHTCGFCSPQAFTSRVDRHGKHCDLVLSWRHQVFQHYGRYAPIHHHLSEEQGEKKITYLACRTEAKSKEHFQREHLIKHFIICAETSLPL